MASYDAGKTLSSSSKGFEREIFVEEFLKQVYPNNFRFGNGDVVDNKGRKSGQIDIVVEAPFLYSFPAHPNGPRLYPAESVVAIIEVKSDLIKQWSQVKKSVEKIRKIERVFVKQHYEKLAKDFLRLHLSYKDREESILRKFSESYNEIYHNYKEIANSSKGNKVQIPIYVIGFKGWKTLEKTEEKRANLNLDGLIVLEHLIGTFGELNSTEAQHHTFSRFASGPSTLIKLLDRLYLDAINNIDQVSGSKNYNFY